MVDTQIHLLGQGVLMMDTNRNLATLRPDIAREWHPTLNGELRPEDLAVSSGRKVWWVCEEGHPPWSTSVNRRTWKNGSGCPYCSGRLPIKGETDLATRRPDIAKEWHPTKNGDLTPDQVTFGSGRKVWWVCGHGHGWEARVCSRTSQNATGCPYCANRARHAVVSRDYDSTFQRPYIAGRWEFGQGEEFTLDQLKVISRPKVWWVDDEWT